MIDVRDRLSEGVNGARLNLELKRAARPTITVVAGGLLALAIAIYIFAHVSRTLLDSTHQVRFAVSDATGVVAGQDQVRFKGIPAGTITAVRIDGNQAVLTATIQNRYGPIYRNAQAMLRPNTALQDMYLDIVNRGTPSAGLASPQATLPRDQTNTAVNIDDVLNVFNSNVRAQLRSLLDNLGNGLRDRGAALRTAFVQVVPFLEVAGRISRQLAERAPVTAQLVHNTAILTSHLGQRQSQLETLIRTGSQTLQTLQLASSDLAGTLRELPPTLASIQSAFAAIRGVLPAVDNAVEHLYPVAGQLPGALANLRALSTYATPAVRALQTPVERLVPLAQVLVPLSASLNAAVGALAPQLGTLNHTTSDVAACKTAIQGFFQWDASLSKYGDLYGPVPRGNVVAGAQSSGLVGSAYETAPQACAAGRPIGGRVPTGADEH